MVRIGFIEQNGRRTDCMAEPGSTIMEIAKRNAVAAIEGECGGACACATCHVYIPQEWRELTGSRSAFESEMLEMGLDVDERSRLSCQITVTADMDGLTVLTPRSQR